jgi:hypothetical protein
MNLQERRGIEAPTKIFECLIISYSQNEIQS